jgi:hypothetical protein
MLLMLPLLVRVQTDTCASHARGCIRRRSSRKKVLRLSACVITRGKEQGWSPGASPEPLVLSMHIRPYKAPSFAALADYRQPRAVRSAVRSCTTLRPAARGQVLPSRVRNELLWRYRYQYNSCSRVFGCQKTVKCSIRPQGYPVVTGSVLHVLLVCIQ